MVPDTIAETQIGAFDCNNLEMRTQGMSDLSFEKIYGLKDGLNNDIREL